MDEILAALGLPTTATPGQAVDAIEAMKAQIAALKLSAKGLPKDIDPAALAAKMSVGLDRETAIEVLRNQAAEDAAATPAPKGKGR